jgi:TrmH family RNA methyltransferase
MQLSSPQNPFLKKVRQAAESGRAMEDGLLLAEGPHLVSEALNSLWRVRHVLATPESIARLPELFNRLGRIEVTEVAERAFHSLASTEHTQGVLALVEPRRWELAELFLLGGPLVILDGIQDPGNAGTIVRSAEAFGTGGVLFVEGSVRVGNAKVLRASAGSIFRMPFHEGSGAYEVINEARSAGVKLFALAAKQEPGAIPRLPADGRFAFVVGSEGRGVQPKFMAAAEALAIPTVKVESLNAAVACSIVLFEAARQRGIS